MSLGTLVDDRPTQLFYIYSLCKHTNLKDTAGQSATLTLSSEAQIAGALIAALKRQGGDLGPRAKITGQHLGHAWGPRGLEPNLVENGAQPSKKKFNPDEAATYFQKNSQNIRRFDCDQC